LRVCLQALAAVAGGRNPCTPTRMTRPGPAHRGSAKLALRTQQILAHESGIADAVTLRGSWLIEKWTDEIFRKSRSI